MEKEIVVSKLFKVRPSKDSDESKRWSLELTIPADTTMNELAQAVLASEVIKVQNGNRDKFDKYPDGHVFKKTFNKPGIQVDPKQALIAQARAAGVDVTDKIALTEWIMSQM
jgi:hypothetical protein